MKSRSKKGRQGPASRARGQSVPEAARITAPPELTDTVTRSALLDRVLADAHCRLTYVQAPAGHGKTSFLLQLRRDLLRRGARCAWASLRQNDNELGRFVELVHGALEQDRTGDGGERPAAKPGGLGPTEYLVKGISSLGADGSLFLDDFENISNPLIFDTLEQLVHRMPEGSRLVIAGRTHPELGLAQLQVKELAQVFGPEELRFSRDETFRFLALRHGDCLDEEDGELLYAYTEGWPGALQLASLAIRNHRDHKAWMRSFVGGQADVAEYLTREVLQRLPEEVREFLLTTSVLERLNGDLCDSLTGRRDSGAILAGLENLGVLIRPLDSERHWYQYHPLLGHTLRRALDHETPGRSEELCLAAAGWFVQHDLHSEAIDYALSAGDVPLAAASMESSAADMVARSRLRTIRRWVEGVPQELLPELPHLQSGAVWSYSFLREFPASHAILGEMECRLEQDPDDAELNDAVCVLRPIIFVGEDRLAEFEAATAQGMAQIVRRDTFEFGALANCHAYSLIRASRFDVARSVLLEALAVNQRCASVFGGSYSSSLLGWLYFARGRLQAALECFRDGLQAAGADTAGTIGFAVLASQMGKALYEAGDLEQARVMMTEALPVIREACLTDWLITTYVALARISAARGQQDEASVLLDEAEALGHRFGFTRLVTLLQWERSRRATLEGDFERARALMPETIERHVPKTWRLPDGFLEDEQLVGLRLAICAGDARPALARVDQNVVRARDRNQMHLAIKLEIFAALAQHALGRENLAIRRLRRAIDMAAPEGFVRVFVDEGPSCLDLVQRVYAAMESASVSEGSRRLYAFLDRVLADAGRDTSVHADGESGSGGSQLTERELSLLRMLADGAPNKTIAACLGVSENTVKWHLRNLYGKLAVNNRTQAAARGRQLGLVDQR